MNSRGEAWNLRYRIHLSENLGRFCDLQQPVRVRFGGRGNPNLELQMYSLIGTCQGLGHYEDMIVLQVHGALTGFCGLPGHLTTMNSMVSMGKCIYTQTFGTEPALK